MSIVNPSNLRVIEDLLNNFLPYAKERLGYKDSPSIRFAKDPDNAKNPLGKTGYYEPDHSRITVYIDGRHPKDIMRSVSHELVHHAQNVRGDLAGTHGVGEQGYAQNNDHLREMEREAYEQGNLCFRDWEDGIKSENPNMYESLKRNLKESQFAATASEEAQKINAEAGIHLNTEQEYWERVGIRTGEELAIEILTGTYSDMYKSVHGVRPRRSFSSVEAVQAAIEDLDTERDSLDWDAAEDYRKNQEIIASLMPNEMDVEYEKMPKRSGMGRAAMQEELNMFERRNIKLNQRLMESFGYKVPVVEGVGTMVYQPILSDEEWETGDLRTYEVFASEEEAQARFPNHEIQQLSSDDIEDAYWADTGEPVEQGAALEESSVEPKQGDDVRIIGGALTGAEGEVMELTTTTQGHPALVVYLRKDADKRVYGAAGDEVIVQPKFVEVDRGIQDYDDSDNPEDDYNWVGHRAHYQEGKYRSGEDTIYPDQHNHNLDMAQDSWEAANAQAKEDLRNGTVDQEKLKYDEEYREAIEAQKGMMQEGGSMAEYGRIDAEDGNPPSKIGQGNSEYMKAYNSVLMARGEEPLPIIEPDQAYVDALRSGNLEEGFTYMGTDKDGNVVKRDTADPKKKKKKDDWYDELNSWTKKKKKDKVSEESSNVINGEKPERMWASIVDNTPMRGGAIAEDELIAAVTEENPDLYWDEVKAFLDALVKQKSIRRNSDEGFGDEYQMMSEGESRHSIPDFFDSDEEKEMMRKMSKKDFYNYVTRDRHSREMSPDEINAIESFNNWLNDKSVHRLEREARKSTWEPAQSYRGGRVLAYNKKEGTWLDVMNDMPVSDEEMEKILPEAKLQAALKAKLTEVFAKYPQLASNKDFINTIKEGVKSKIMEKQNMKKLNKDFGTLVAEGVVDKLKERWGEDEFGSMFDSYDDDEDEMGLEPSPEEEEIEALLKQYGLSKDAGPAADAEAGAAAMADMEDDADLGRRPEEDEEEDPARRATVMKEDDGEYAHLGIKTTQDQYGPLHVLPNVQFTGDIAADIKQIQQNDELDSWLWGELGSDESITDAAGKIVYSGADVQDHVGAEADHDGSYQPRMAEGSGISAKEFAMQNGLELTQDNNGQILIYMDSDQAESVDFGKGTEDWEVKGLDAGEYVIYTNEYPHGQTDMDETHDHDDSYQPRMAEGAGGITPEQYAEENGFQLEYDQDRQKMIFISPEQFADLRADMDKLRATLSANEWSLERDNDGQAIIYTNEYDGQPELNEACDHGWSDKRNTRLNETLMKWAIK